MGQVGRWDQDTEFPITAGQPNNIHMLTFDHRGFERSSGAPSESGILLDALAVAEWAMVTAAIPRRILIFGQSLSAAVSLAMAEHFALQTPPVVFAGTVLVDPFSNVAKLASTYRVAAIITVISPLAKTSVPVRSSIQPCIRYMAERRSHRAICTSQRGSWEEVAPGYDTR